MRKKCIVLFLWLAVLNIVGADASNKIQLQIGDRMEIGRKDLMFASIASVCESPDSHFYVLDRMEHKVFKFAPDGELVLTFGQEGQGPGDFQNPLRLACAFEGQIVVADEMYDLSFLDDKGIFIERVHLDGRLAVGFIGKNRFYGWVWGKEDQSQVMVDEQNNVLKTFFQVPKSAFSVSAPDESGRRVMFNFSRDAFAPGLEFAHFGLHTAIGIGDMYDILILDDKGETVSHIKREILPDSFSKEEKKFFEKDIREFSKDRGWPGSVVRELIKKIPDKKIYFDEILLNEKYVFVFRIKEDISEENSPVPVDIFSIEGKFLGSVEMPGKPLHISEKHLYFVRSDEKDNLYLEKATYRLVLN